MRIEYAVRYDVDILLAQTDAAIMITSYRELVKELDKDKEPRFKIELMRRAVYERMVAEGKILLSLIPAKR